MSEILISPNWNPKPSSSFLANVFWCHISYWNIFHKPDIYNFIYINIHMEKTFKDNVKSVENISRKMGITEHLQKKVPDFFLVPVWICQYFRHISQNPNLILISSFSNNQYWAYTFLNPGALEPKQTQKKIWPYNQRSCKMCVNIG